MMSYFAEKIHERFRLFLKARGLAVTPQREHVLTQVLTNSTHFDLEALVRQIETNGVAVSRATVYRTITHLEEAGIVRRAHMHQGRAFYEITPGRQRHEHLVCRVCGKVKEFSHRAFEKQIEEIARDHGFRISGHSVELFGICKDCIKKEIHDACTHRSDTTHPH
jgi:Fur family ferric uptake transcriptional regulator